MSSVDAVRLACLQFAIGLLFATIGISSSGAEETAAPPGEALYQQRCASCHEGSVARAPDRTALRQLSEQPIGFQLAYGLMSQQGRELSKDQIGAIVDYLKGTAPVAAPALPDSSCRDDGPKLTDASLPRWNGWGVDLHQHRFQPADQAQLAAEDVPRLKLKWAFGFPGDVRASAQPTVWGRALFVGSAGGKVYALDAMTDASVGCSMRALVSAALSPSARMPAASPPILATSSAMPMRSTPKPGNSGGRAGSRNIRRP